jgi:hypothetical protein
MKKARMLLALLILLNTNLIANNNNTKDAYCKIEKDSGDLIGELEKLIICIDNLNYNEIKEYIKFPLLNSDIWYVVLPEDEYESFDFSKSFTEKDYDKYCNKIFSKEFIEGLKLIDFSILRQENYYKTDSYSSQDDRYLMIYWLELDLAQDALTITLNSKVIDIDYYGDFSDHQAVYSFAYKNNTLRLESYMMFD